MSVRDDDNESRGDAEHEQDLAPCQTPFLRKDPTDCSHEQEHLHHEQEHIGHDQDHFDHGHDHLHDSRDQEYLYDLDDSHLVLDRIKKNVREGRGVRYTVVCQCQAVVRHCKRDGVGDDDRERDEDGDDHHERDGDGDDVKYDDQVYRCLT